MTIIVNKKAIKEKPKRKYNTVTKETVKSGEIWKINLPIDKDVALKIIEEKEESSNGGEYFKIINNRLRKAYGIRVKK